MEPVTLILTALTAGVALGVKDTASTAVRDAYGTLKALLRKRLACRQDGELALSRYEQAPDTWAAPLTAELEAVGAGTDADLVESARALMELTDAKGAREGKYTVQVSGGLGVQVGDQNTQHNSFGSSVSRTGSTP
jgi:hypothetical protein